VRSDEVRKELAHAHGLANIGGSSEYSAGMYTPEWTERTYEACLARVDAALFEGKRVLVDATFRAESHRLEFLDLAARWSVPAIFLICQAGALVVKARLERRRDDVSDADWGIYVQAAQRWETLGARMQQLAHPIDTGRSDPQPLQQALGNLRQHELWE
jgi:predicted kinase